MLCRTRKLYFRKNNTTYSINLWTSANDWGYKPVGVKVDGQTLYFPCANSGSETGGHSNTINIKWDGRYIYYAIDTNNQIKLIADYHTKIIKNTSGVVTSYEKTLEKVWISGAPINTSLDIYMSSNNGNSYTKVGTLTSGSTSVTINRTMTSTANQFKVRIQTSTSLTQKSGSVHFSGAEAGVGRVTAEVTISSELAKGKIVVVGEWNSLAPPWHTEGESLVINTGRKYGSASRDFLSSGLTCAMRLYYKPQTSGLGNTKLAEVEWPSLGLWVVDKTVNFTFKDVTGSPSILFTWSINGTGSATSQAMDYIPMEWW